MLLLSKAESDKTQRNHAGMIQDTVEDYPYWHAVKVSCGQRNLRIMEGICLGNKQA
jgi:hypothetical protein